MMLEQFLMSFPPQNTNAISNIVNRLLKCRDHRRHKW